MRTLGFVALVGVIAGAALAVATPRGPGRGDPDAAARHTLDTMMVPLGAPRAAPVHTPLVRAGVVRHAGTVLVRAGQLELVVAWTLPAPSADPVDSVAAAMLYGGVAYQVRGPASPGWTRQRQLVPIPAPYTSQPYIACLVFRRRSGAYDPTVCTPRIEVERRDSSDVVRAYTGRAYPLDSAPNTWGQPKIAPFDSGPARWRTL